MSAPEPKRRGRPPLPPGASTEAPVRTMRLSDDLWAELQSRGGVAAVREWLSQRKPAGYAICVHPADVAMLNELPDGQWVILQRRVVPFAPTPKDK